MKKLDLDKEKYITITIYNVGDSSVTYCVPEILKDNQVIKNNIEEHTISLLIDYFDFLDERNKLCNELKDCIFRCEKENIQKQLLETNDKLYFRKATINKDLYPYCWEVYKNFKRYVPQLDKVVKDDYVLIFSKKEDDIV